MSEAAPSAPAAAPAAPPAENTPPPTTPAVETKAAETKGETPARHKVKVDGEEKEVTLEELVKGYQTDAAGQKRLKEAAELKQAAEADKASAAKIVKAAKAGDYTALRELGLSDAEIETLAVKMLSEKQQQKLEQERREALDPEKRELEDLRKFKEEQEAKAKETEQTAEEKQVETVTNALRTSVIDTLELLPENMRRNGFFANRAIEAWEYAVEHAEEIKAAGIEVTPQFIAEKVLGEARSLSKALYLEMLAAAKDEELDQYVPKEVWERWQKRAAAAVDGGEPPPPAPTPDHPALASKPQVRDGAQQDGEQPKKRRFTDAQIMRSAITGKPPAGPR